MIRILPVALLVVAAACGSRSVGTAPAPDDKPSVRVWRQELEDNSNSTIIWAENTGKVPVVISQLRLYSCANLYQECGLHAPNVRIEPGRTARVARLDPADHRQRPRYGYEYQWRAVRQASATPPPAVTTAMITRDGVTTRLEPIAVGEWQALVPPDEANGSCIPMGPSPGEGRMLHMQFGPRGQRPVRMVLVTLDAGGRIIAVNDSRGDMRRSMPGGPEARVVNDPGPRTTIVVDLLRGTALLINQPAEGPVEQHHATARGLLDAPTLGPLRPVAERVVRECGSR